MRGSVALVGLAACNVRERIEEKRDPIDLGQQGIAAFVRTVDGDRLLEAGISAGGTDDAAPDAQSQAYFFDVLPGLSPTDGLADGYARAGAVPDVPAAGLAATVLSFAPADTSERDRAAFEVSFEGVTLAVPADSVERDDALLEAWTLTTLRATPEARDAVPGGSLGLVNDAEVRQVAIHEAFSFQGGVGLLRALLIEGAEVPVTMTVPEGSPLLDEPVVEVWSWDFSAGWWRRRAVAEVDVDARTVSFVASSFGWWALATSGDPECVPGTVHAGGAAIDGVEVRIARDGVLGLDRVTTDDGGAWCAPGGTGTWRAVGVRSDLGELYLGSGAYAGGGDLVLDVLADGDGDRAFPGPGGDCDDGDPRVSPDFVKGDASWCGSGL